ncbi:hypothetical protein HpNP15_10390 [Helicobacter pylori]
MKKALLLTLFFSFWLHAERNGFYLGLNFLEGSYIKGQGSIGEKASAENALNQAINNAKNSLFPEQNYKSHKRCAKRFKQSERFNKNR